MSTLYSDDDLLALSGIQHFAFCKRQWGLIHIERQWQENVGTIEGQHLHQYVNNPDFYQMRDNVVTARSLPIVSYKLGFYGVADVVEFHKVDNKKGVMLSGRKGLWMPVPVEYKRGRPKTDDIDTVQLCAQAICIEEMFKISIGYGYIYYGQTRHRSKIIFSDSLRQKVFELSQAMHKLFEEKITPKAEPGKNCKACSLVDICMPQISKRNISVKVYLKNNLD
ncbi:MAG TPA: CRISPR-associated protein Cas4 [Clostridiaceae bacterium]|nr:CRISPR-associated protein Cas4 [Clostridiaceae bacterium]